MGIAASAMGTYWPRMKATPFEKSCCTGEFMDGQAPSNGCTSIVDIEAPGPTARMLEARPPVAKGSSMQIQVRTSNGIENKDALERWADGQIRQTLSRFIEDVTRVEIHLSDENHDASGGGAKRCVMEARLAHHQPLAVTQHAPSLD